MTATAPPPAWASYLDLLGDHLRHLRVRRAEQLDRVARRVATSVGDGGVVHVFGCGHSQLVAVEISERAGGLAAVNAIADPALSPAGGARAAATERLPGYGNIVLDSEDLRAGEVLIVVSNAGINAVPIDVAAGARERGLFVVAVTSLVHSAEVASRHPDGLRLADVADVTIDTEVPVGDVALWPTDQVAVGPMSTVVAAALVHAILTGSAAMLAAAGAQVPVLISQNLDGEVDPNAEVRRRYADRRGGRS